MEQLIFVGIILFFSMLEAVARKKREAETGDAPLPAPPTDQSIRLPRVPERSHASYDDEPSFDDAVKAGSGRGRDDGVSTEGLIPADVWEEIQALARGGKAPVRGSPRPAPAPRPVPAPVAAPTRTVTRAPRAVTPPMSTAARTPRAPAAVPADAVPAPEHAVHRAHAKFGKPVHDRLTGFAEESGGPRRTSAQADAVRAALRGGGAALRQAILLQEILGPPVSLKDDPSAG